MSIGLDLENMSTEDFDDKLGSLQKIIEKQIELLDNEGLNSEARKLEELLTKEMNL